MIKLENIEGKEFCKAIGCKWSAYRTGLLITDNYQYSCLWTRLDGSRVHDSCLYIDSTGKIKITRRDPIKTVAALAKIKYSDSKGTI